MHYRPLNIQYTSPIEKLPVELLSYIFLLGTCTAEEFPKDNDRSLPFTTESIKAPLLFSSVNKHWRSIALNTPTLWTSICVTAEMINTQEDHSTSGAFNIGHLNTYIPRSRKYPLDILIDARDQDWDFSEPEISSEYECGTYTPPFSSAHMSTAISLLLPHLSRWRSFAILTDTWAPMYVALQQIQPLITTLGAPLLESLIVMRCNDFVSYSPTFQPHKMKDPALFTLPDEISSPSLLPRLKNLTLRGVHVDWASLASILSHSHVGLRSLELASHCLDVRPSFPEFHRLLDAVPSLNKLVIIGSGPDLPDDADNEESIFADEDDLCPVSFPNLRTLTIGYRSAYEGRALLECISAPNIQDLTIEDSTHPGDPEDIDAGKLLAYIGTGRFYDANEHIFVSYINGRHYKIAVDDTTRNPLSCSQREKLCFKSPFPLLEKVTLNGVKACPGPLHAFFGGLQNVRQLELSRMSVHAIHALRPYDSSRCPASNSPCPRLQSLCIRRPELTQWQETVILVGCLALERLTMRVTGLQEVDVHVDDTDEPTEEAVVWVSPSTKLTVFRDEELDSDDVESDELDVFLRRSLLLGPVSDAFFGVRSVAY